MPGNLEAQNSRGANIRRCNLEKSFLRINNLNYTKFIFALKYKLCTKTCVALCKEKIKFNCCRTRQNASKMPILYIALYSCFAYKKCVKARMHKFKLCCVYSQTFPQ